MVVVGGWLLALVEKELWDSGCTRCCSCCWRRGGRACCRTCGRGGCYTIIRRPVGSSCFLDGELGLNYRVFARAQLSILVFGFIEHDFDFLASGC